MTDCGWELFRGSGRGLISFSRPGYGRTQVGRRTAAEFVPAIDEVCVQLGVTSGSAAPSTLPYPDSHLLTL